MASEHVGTRYAAAKDNDFPQARRYAEYSASRQGTRCCASSPSDTRGRTKPLILIRNLTWTGCISKNSPGNEKTSAPGAGAGFSRSAAKSSGKKWIRRNTRSRNESKLSHEAASKHGDAPWHSLGREHVQTGMPRPGAQTSTVFLSQVAATVSPADGKPASRGRGRFP